MRRGWKNLVVTIVVVAVAATVWIAYWIGTREPRRAITCIGNLRVLSPAVFHWMLTREGRTLASLESLLGQPGITRKTFICPASGSTLQDDRFVCDYDSIFDRGGRAVSFQSFDDLSHTMMIWDREAVHNDGAPYRHVLFADGSIRQVHEAEFEAAIKKLDAITPRAKKK